jgi:hypothetical protein
MALKYCPNGECVNFQSDIDTEATRCPMCAWKLVLVKKNSETATEDQQRDDSQTA